MKPSLETMWRMDHPAPSPPRPTWRERRKAKKRQTANDKAYKQGYMYGYLGDPLYRPTNHPRRRWDKDSGYSAYLRGYRHGRDEEHHGIRKGGGGG